jgi:hypothetical protein
LDDLLLILLSLAKNLTETDGFSLLLIQLDFEASDLIRLLLDFLIIVLLYPVESLDLLVPLIEFLSQLLLSEKDLVDLGCSLAPGSILDQTLSYHLL